MDQILTKLIEKIDINLFDKLIPITVAILSFVLAYYLLGITNIKLPIAYDGSDTIFMSWLIKRQIDGAWYFHGAYSGFPFGSDFLDYPLSDSGNFLILKIIGNITHNFAETFNLYFLLGFSITSLISYIVLKKLGICFFYSIVGGILFSFLPFHFMRVAHLFYTWYFHIPIYIWFAFKIFSKNSVFFEKNKSIIKNLQSVAILLIASCFGIYYAFFASIILLATGIMGSLRFRSKKNIISAILSVFIITTGVGLNISPTYIYAYKHGINYEVSPRQSFESELNALKLVQMLLPHPMHRSTFLREISNQYNYYFPLVSENLTSSLGCIGSLGLIFLLIIAMGAPFFWFSIDMRLQLLAFISILSLLIATVGGFSSIFAMFITPMIRGWNRISVFIGFISIFAFLIFMQSFIKKNFILFFTSLLFLMFGIWDQTFPLDQVHLKNLHNEYLSDKFFVREIEYLIPNGAIYQLPYTPFPEGKAVKNVSYLISYDLLRGYMHSSTLHWSSGGMIGRQGDLFFRNLADQPIYQQILVIKKLGFNGIYIDRRGYSDHGASIEKEISETLGHKVNIVSENNNLSFFCIPI